MAGPDVQGLAKKAKSRMRVFSFAQQLAQTVIAREASAKQFFGSAALSFIEPHFGSFSRNSNASWLVRAYPVGRPELQPKR